MTLYTQGEVFPSVLLCSSAAHLPWPNVEQQSAICCAAALWDSSAEAKRCCYKQKLGIYEVGRLFLLGVKNFNPVKDKILPNLPKAFWTARRNLVF